MLKRIFWFVTGTGFGFWLAVRLGRSVRESVERYSPDQVVGRVTRELRAAVAEGREAMRQREAELRSRQLIEPVVSGQGRGSEM